MLKQRGERKTHKRKGKKKSDYVYFVAERDKITEGTFRFLAQSKNGRASTVAFIDLVHTQFLNFSLDPRCKQHKLN